MKSFSDWIILAVFITNIANFALVESKLDNMNKQFISCYAHSQASPHILPHGSRQLYDESADT